MFSNKEFYLLHFLSFHTPNPLLLNAFLPQECILNKNVPNVDNSTQYET